MSLGAAIRPNKLLFDVGRTMQLYRGSVAKGDATGASENAGELEAYFVRTEAVHLRKQDCFRYPDFIGHSDLINFINWRNL